jgi:hypothetical protein
VIALIVLFGIAGVFNGLATMAISPFGGFICCCPQLPAWWSASSFRAWSQNSS